MAWSRLIFALLASLATGLGFWFGTGLTPLWWATWLAPLPVLVVAPRLSTRGVFVTAMAGWLIGALNMWDFLGVLPLAVRILFVTLPAVAFAVGMTGYAHFSRRGKVGLAVLAPAAVVTAYEYVIASVSPHGTYGSLAYSQADCLAVLQLAALGGIWPVVFVLLVTPSLLALGIAPGQPRASRIRALVACAGVAVAVGGWGTWRLRAPGPAAAITVGLVASDLPVNQPFLDPARAPGILEGYLAAVPAMAAAGAELIVMPEHLLAMREAAPDENAAALGQRLRETAVAHESVIVIGVDRTDADGLTWNEARVHASGTPAVVAYQKQHLLPGLESFCTPGQGPVTFEFHDIHVGLAICKDLDFPATGRAYADRAIDLLCVPAFDFVADGWLHGRMAAVRGVESGFSVVRAARGGRLTVSDAWGRIIAEARSDAADYATLVATFTPRRVDTLYARHGDWFGWTAIATCLGLVGSAARRRHAA